MTKTLKKLINDEDIHHTSFNFAVAYGIGFTANIISNFAFGFPLNHYHSVEHFAVGVGIGTLAYRKVYQRTGNRIKGVAAGLFTGTVSSICWEWFENKYVFKEKEVSLDTALDFVAIWGGNITSFAVEKWKEYINKKND